MSRLVNFQVLYIFIYMPTNRRLGVGQVFAGISSSKGYMVFSIAQKFANMKDIIFCSQVLGLGGSC